MRRTEESACAQPPLRANTRILPVSSQHSCNHQCMHRLTHTCNTRTLTHAHTVHRRGTTHIHIHTGMTAHSINRTLTTSSAGGKMVWSGWDRDRLANAHANTRKANRASTLSNSEKASAPLPANSCANSVLCQVPLTGMYRSTAWKGERERERAHASVLLCTRTRVCCVVKQERARAREQGCVCA